MGALLFGLVAGSGLTWVFMELRRDGYWREFNVRRRGSNPSPPGRKPPPPAGPPEQPLAAQLIRMDEGRDAVVLEPLQHLLTPEQREQLLQRLLSCSCWPEPDPPPEPPSMAAIEELYPLEVMAS
jgi:hypothetical protein